MKEKITFCKRLKQWCSSYRSTKNNICRENSQCGADCISPNLQIVQKPKKRVCVIGAGVSGLTAAKALKDEGLTPVVFELKENLGGLWRYDSSIPSPAYRSLKTNTHKNSTQFADMAMPDDFPAHPTWQQVISYLENYATRFDLHQYIQFNTKVLSVTPHGKGWRITYDHCGTRHTENFSAVAICSGQYRAPRSPTIEGSDSFTGSQLHSSQYKEPSSFAGKVVLVNGLGASGTDIARELQGVAADVIHSTKRRDHITSPITTNLHTSIKRISRDIVFFNDGSSCRCDVIIHATGYSLEFPFLSSSLIQIKSTPCNYIPLYKHVFPPHLKNIGFIGMVSTDGSVHPLAETQSKWFAKVVGGTTRLPSQHEMESEVSSWEEIINEYNIDYKPMEVVSASYKLDIARIIEENSVTPAPSSLCSSTSALATSQPQAQPSHARAEVAGLH